jgi:hypothetical protein
VAKIAPLPDAQSAWLNPDLKEYPTQIHLSGRHPELRTGMSCQAQILVEQLGDATYVPIQAVVRVAGQPTVYVRRGDGFDSRTVAIGLDNNSMVHVASGLEPGEVVSLAPPLGSDESSSFAAESMQVAATDETPSAGPSAEAPPLPVAAASGPTEARGPGETHQPTAREERGGRSPFGGELSEEERAARRERFRNMTPEEREAAMQERLKDLPPEERERMLQRMRERMGGGGGGSGAGP